MNKQMIKGISLVALVVTIIVLIILTGTVLATFMEGGIIDRSKEAVKRSDATTLREAYDVKYNEKKIEGEIDLGREVSIIDVLEETVRQVGMEKDFEVKMYGEVREIIYKGENEYIQEWLGQILNQAAEKGEWGESGLILSNGYLTNIKKETTLEEIERTTGGVVEGGIIKTGAKIKDTQGNVIATIVIFGETNCDSVIDILDASEIINNIIREKFDIQEAMYAADINGDGIVSLDDKEFIQRSIMDSTIDMNAFQKRVISAKPKMVDKTIYEDGYIYKWYTIEDIKNKLIEKGYTIKEYKVGYPIVTDGSLTYEKLESDINDTFGEGKVISIKADDKKAVIPVSTRITIKLPFKINDSKYNSATSIVFKIVAE